MLTQLPRDSIEPDWFDIDADEREVVQRVDYLTVKSVPEEISCSGEKPHGKLMAALAFGLLTFLGAQFGIFVMLLVWVFSPVLIVPVLHIYQVEIRMRADRTIIDRRQIETDQIARFERRPGSRIVARLADGRDLGVTLSFIDTEAADYLVHVLNRAHRDLVAGRDLPMEVL